MNFVEYYCRSLCDAARRGDEAGRMMVTDVLEALQSTPSAWSSLVTDSLWDSILASVRALQQQGQNFDLEVAGKHFQLAERILGHSGEAASSSSAKGSASAERRQRLKDGRLHRSCESVSDSDSAFYASDVSLERLPRNIAAATLSFPVLIPVSKDQEQANSAPLPQAKHYLELLRSDSPGAALCTGRHLSSLVAGNHHRPLRFQIFARVMLPFLQDQTLTPSAAASVDDVPMTSEAAAGRVQTIRELLSVLPGLITKEKDVLAFFRQHKVLKIVMAFRAVPGVVGETYSVLRAFVEAEIEGIMYSKEFRRVLTTTTAASEAVGAATDLESSSDDVLEAPLTDEEAFQPRFMKALTLTSIVKEFHEILISRTARILDHKDLKQGSPSNTNSASLQWEELMHAWKTQASLMHRFPEYRQYAHSKGIPRIVEELFAFLVTQVATLPAADIVRAFVLPTFGYLLRVMVQLRKVDRGSLEVADEDDGDKILDQGLTVLIEESLKTTCAATLRKTVCTLVEAAVCDEDGSAEHRRHLPGEDNGPAKEDLNYDADVSDSETVFKGREKDNATSKCRKEGRGKDIVPQIVSPKVVISILELVVKLVLSGHRYGPRTAEYSLYKLRRLCAAEGNAAVLLKSGLLGKLIRSFHSMAVRSPGLREEVLNLVVLLARRRMSREEFRSLLGIFKLEFLDEDIRKGLLRGLCQVAAGSSSALAPSYSIVTPNPCREGDLKLMSSARRRQLSQGSSGNSNEEIAKALFTGFPKGLLSFNIPSPSTFSMTSKKGFSICAWVKPALDEENGAGERGCCEATIVSLSEGTARFQVSLSRSTLTVTLVEGGSPAPAGGSPTGAAASREPLRPSRSRPATATFQVAGALRMRWNHFVVSCLVKGKFLEVAATVNGCLLQSLLIPLKGKALSAPSTSPQAELELAVGERSNSRNKNSHAEIASVHIFQDTLASSQAGKSVAALLLIGPDEAVSPAGAGAGDRDLNLRKRELLKAFPEHKTSFCDLNLHLGFGALEESLALAFSAR